MLLHRLEAARRSAPRPRRELCRCREVASPPADACAVPAGAAMGAAPSGVAAAADVAATTDSLIVPVAGAAARLGPATSNGFQAQPSVFALQRRVWKIATWPCRIFHESCSLSGPISALLR